ncbi:MAG TPA: sigma-70 family RNA polymerase sigma factor [Pyrinomonadaceae bacterium]
MLKPAILPDSHEDIFIARYRRLTASALRLVEGQRAQAEDLVQDAFIQFTLKRPDLNTIESLDDYLYVMLRNLHISQARRASQSQTTQLVISDYDTAQMGLRLLDPQRRLQARDDLRRVCEYVTQRKETSKAGSVLILRFFHNYFPAEIATVLRTTRTAVEVWLLNARREARLFLEDPLALKVISKQKAIAKKVVQLSSRISSHKHAEITNELQEMIFSSRQGQCLSGDQLGELYAAGGETIKSPALAHIVSCVQCLDGVNDLLGLPSLAERNSDATSDSSAPPPDLGGPSGPSGASGAGGGEGEVGSRLRRRRRETIEHRPQELRIAVNGFFVGGQKIGLPINELTLKLNLEEKISFVEAFSEQGLLLSHFRVTPPTDGEIEQREEVEFGEGRALEMGVNFDTQWPTLHVVYRDPLVAHLQAEAGEEVQSPKSNVQSLHEDVGVQRKVGSIPEAGLLGAARKRWSGFGHWTFDFGLFLRPATITALVALLLVATTVILTRWQGPTAPLTAADVLQRASKAETVAAVSPDTAIHRTLQIEERGFGQTVNTAEPNAGELIAQRRVEVWQSTARGVTARRLYDDRGRLLAGEWSRSDNVTTVYHHAARPQLKPSGPIQAEVSLDNVWQLEPSAKDFAALVGDTQHVGVAERANQYVLSFESATPTSTHKILCATLVLGRDDLHAVEQTLWIQHGTEVRAYRISETSLERRPNDAVAPAVFEPDPELLSSTENRNPKLETTNLAPDPRSLAPVIATPALEVEVLQLLNQANAFMGEQLSVTRTSEGKLLVSGLVDTTERKAELLRALSTVRGNPAVRVQVETVAEASQRERPKSTGNITVEHIETTEGTSAAYADLKQKFSDDEARRFADRVMSRSRQARRHALALKQLAERFSLTDLQTLSATDRARWLGLLRDHARDFEREAATLRRDLQQVFPALSAAASNGPTIGGDAQIQDTVRRLYELSVACDEQVRQSFALSVERPSTAPVKSQQFWRTLSAAEGLSKSIQAIAPR